MSIGRYPLDNDPPAEGDTLVFHGGVWTPSAPSGPSGQTGGALEPVAVVSVYATEVAASPPSGAATIDGYAVQNGDRVLLTHQTTSADDGIWIANTAGAWTRATDAAAGAHIPDGTLIPVAGGPGSFFYNSIWQLGGPWTVGGALNIQTSVMGSSEVWSPTTPGNAPAFSQEASVVVMQNLPTADPHAAGHLWNNAGVVTISAG